ncbi:MAG: PAS domain S-box protein [Candidatus Competibacteraceae bacterium]
MHLNSAVIILNFDVDATARRHKSDTLRSAGYTVIEAATAGEAWRQNQTERPTVVILNMHHAAEEALLLGRQFKAAAMTTPILLLAPASGDPAPWEDSADICLREPFTPAQFLAQVKLLARLAQSETAQLTLSTLLKYIPEGVTLTGGPPDFPIIANSRLAQELTGQPEETLVGLSAGHHVEAYGLFLADGITRPTPEQMPLYRATRLGETITDEEWVIHRPDGSAIIVLVNVVPIRDAAGRIGGAINCWHDITKHKQIERALRRANERFRLAEAAANGFVYDWDLTTGQVERTDGITRLLGYSPQEMDAEPGWWRGLMHPEDRESIVVRGREALATGDSYIFEYRVRHRDRHYIDVLDRGIILRDGERQIRRVIGSVIDITEQKQLEMALKRSEERAWAQAEEISALLHAAPAIIFIAHDPDCHAITGSRAAYELLQMPAGNNLSKTAPEGDLLPHFKILVQGVELLPENLPVQQAARGVEVRDFEEEIVFDDGSRWYLYGNATPLRDPAGKVRGAIAAFIDITRRKAVEAALGKSEALYRQLFEGAQDGVALHELMSATTPGYFLQCNRSLCKLLGYTFEEMQRLTPLDIQAPEDIQQVPAELEKIRTEGHLLFEKTLVCKGGRRIPVEINLHTFNLDGKTMVQSIIRDITERKQAEEALREANRRKDEFLAMLAHELRNPLAPIRNAVQILNRLGPAEPKQQWARDVIARQVGHLARLVDDLLDVSRLLRGKITLQHAPLTLSTLVQHAVEISRPLIEARRQTLKIKLPPEPVPLEGDLTRLAQVLANLLNNAAKYTDEGGHIGLEAATCLGEVIIRVRDTGIGIPASLLPHVFDLFTQDERTLDRSQGGLGLGLTVVKNLVELHGGKVEARSDGPGRGSEFIVRLPVPAMTACEHT